MSIGSQNEDVIYNCVFLKNKAKRAGAGLLYASAGNLYNLTFYGNRDDDGASGGGDAGQLCINGNSASGDVVNCVFQGAENTKDLSTWKAGAPYMYVVNSIIQNSSVGQIGGADTSTFKVNASTQVESGAFFKSPSQPAGADNTFLPKMMA
jgi:hypothetical protein